MIGRLFITALLVLVVGSGYAKEDVTILDAVRIAGQQKMLSQKIVTAYLTKSAGINKETAHKELDKSLASFEANLLILEEFAVSGALFSRLQEVEEVWFEFRLMAMDSDKRSNGAAALYEQSGPLLEACLKLEKMLESKSNIKQPAAIKAAETQAMLAQRLAMLYIAYYWVAPKMGSLYGTIGKEFDETAKLYKSTSEDLEKYIGSEGRLYDAYSIVKSKWPFPNKSLRSIARGKMQPKVVNYSMNTIERRMAKIIDMYQKMY